MSSMHLCVSKIKMSRSKTFIYQRSTDEIQFYIFIYRFRNNKHNGTKKQ